MNDDMAVVDLAGPYPESAIAILLENGTQVQRLPSPQDLDKGSENAQTASAVAGPNDGIGGGTGMVSRKASAPAAASGSTNIDRGGESNHQDQGGLLDGQHYTVVFVKRSVITIKIRIMNINQVTALG